MLNHAFSPPAAAPDRPPSPPSGPEPPPAERFVERQEGAWRILPFEGRYELVYQDGGGAWSVRRLAAHDLKIGPGRVLVGGTDRDRGGYRGFRADRIRRLIRFPDDSFRKSYHQPARRLSEADFRIAKQSIGNRMTDRDSGEQVERNILDWLVRRAEATRRARAAAVRQPKVADIRGRRRSGPRPDVATGASTAKNNGEDRPSASRWRTVSAIAEGYETDRFDG